jgi:hypothetical protein
MVRPARRGHHGGQQAARPHQPARRPDRPARDRSSGMASAGQAGQGLVPNLAKSRLKQITAQATSTNANHRPQSRSHHTWSHLKQFTHDSVRSTRQRRRPSRVEDSTPSRAIRGRIPRRRSHARLVAHPQGQPCGRPPSTGNRPQREVTNRYCVTRGRASAPVGASGVTREQRRADQVVLLFPCR